MWKKVVAFGMCATLLFSNSTMVFAMENDTVQTQSESSISEEDETSLSEEEKDETQEEVNSTSEEANSASEEEKEKPDEEEQQEEEKKDVDEAPVESDKEKKEETTESEQKTQDTTEAESQDVPKTEAAEVSKPVENNVIETETEERVYAGSTMGTATNISFNTKYTGTISENSTKDFYKINLSSSGNIRIKSNASIEYLTYRIYDVNGKSLWQDTSRWNTGSEMISEDYSIDLTSGIYYLAIEKTYSCTGRYEIVVNYTNANESFSESPSGENNTILQANKIVSDKTYKGQIATNDDKDFYKIDLAISGTCTLHSNANMHYLDYVVYDENGMEIWRRNGEWNSSSEQIALNETLALTSGIYYVGIIKRYGSTGTYSFNIGFASAEENFKESQGGSDNTMDLANAIRMNTTYLGQIAINDEKDFYKFSLVADDTVHIYAESYMNYVRYKLFRKNGEQVWEKEVCWDSSSKRGVLNKEIDLTAGDYYFEVEKCYGCAGNYSFKLSASKVVNVDKVTGVKIGGRASNALRLNWNKNSQADGYIIEQYKGNQWTRIAKISGNTTTTYRVENLSASNSYKFRVQAYKFSGGTPFYSEYTYIEGKTNPSDVSGLKIGGHAKDALRLNWNRNTSASGYIIEVYKSGSWNRVARISNNTTVTYRVEKLSSNTKYSFRVKAFGFDGSTALYGNAATVSGTTDADGTTKLTNVSGFKIGGRASNALRLNWNRNTSAEGYIIEQYKNGGWSRTARIEGNSTTTKRVENLKGSTQYKFRIKAFKFRGSQPLYSEYAYVTGTTSPYDVTGLRIGGRGADALRLNWNRNVSAEGYIIEQYSYGSWKRVARISDGSITTKRIEKLKASTTYRFRIRAFKFAGETALYSDGYTYVYGTTNPYNVSGVRIGGTAQDALRINWNRNSSAEGYIIEKYQSGSWVRVARISENSTTTYRVAHLQPGSSYVFRIKAFKFAGNTPLYSDYTYVFGDTQSSSYYWNAPLKAAIQKDIITEKIK